MEHLKYTATTTPQEVEETSFSQDMVQENVNSATLNACETPISNNSPNELSKSQEDSILNRSNHLLSSSFGKRKGQ